MWDHAIAVGSFDNRSFGILCLMLVTRLLVRMPQSVSVKTTSHVDISLSVNVLVGAELLDQEVACA